MPFSRVAADTEYGVGDVECALCQSGKGYVLGVASSHWFGSWKRAIGGTAEEIAKAVPPAAW
jgi:SRSO17 transposase